MNKKKNASVKCGHCDKTCGGILNNDIFTCNDCGGTTMTFPPPCEYQVVPKNIGVANKPSDTKVGASGRSGMGGW